MTIDVVVSTCIERDLEIWKYSSRGIIKHFKSEKYVVIVPRASVEKFKVVSPAIYQVISEESVFPDESLQTIQNRLPPALFERAGWYYQQLLKIEYLRSLPRGGAAVIWDADTIPLRDLKFIDDAGRLILRYGVYHQARIHQPYFSLISELLGLSRAFDDSFIAQCFPVRVEWVQAFCGAITLKSQLKWWEAVLSYVATNPSYCAFSEYESLGTYFLSKYPKEVVLQEANFYRPYNAIFPLEQLDSKDSKAFLQAQDYEYVAYDTYESRLVTGLNIGCGGSRIERAVDGGICINMDKYLTSATDMLGDLERGLPFRDAQFNHVVAHNILEHVDDVIKSMRELDRLLAPGGILQIEVPHIGSYNHGTDVTHRRGMTFSSFNFLNRAGSYLYPEGNGLFNYRLISFNKENIVNGDLIREYADEIPARGTYTEWLRGVQAFEIPGTFGFIFQKL